MSKNCYKAHNKVHPLAMVLISDLVEIGWNCITGIVGSKNELK